MKKMSQKKLTLNKETLRSLKTGELIVVAGGAPSWIDFTFCATNCTCPNTE